MKRLVWKIVQSIVVVIGAGAMIYFVWSYTYVTDQRITALEKAGQSSNKNNPLTAIIEIPIENRQLFINISEYKESCFVDNHFKYIFISAEIDSTKVFNGDK
jgi:hypothetical protein